MFENFKKITNKGGCFESDTELEVFKKDEMNVVYGRNGSGKTTIAHCIGELAKPAIRLRCRRNMSCLRMR